MSTAMTAFARMVPASWRHTLTLRAFGLVQVPMLGYCRPTVVSLDEDGVAIRIPLTRRTKNHLNSMYFGVLAVGADCAAGFIALDRITASGHPVALVFKDFRADFLRRPTHDVVFSCRDGRAIAALVDRAVTTGERVDQEVAVVATTPDAGNEEPVARFVLTLSLKLRPKHA